MFKKSVVALTCCYFLSGCVGPDIIPQPPRVYTPPQTQQEIDAENGVEIGTIIYEPIIQGRIEQKASPEFNPAEVQWSVYGGRNTVIGSVEFYPTLQAEPATCAGLAVLAIPDSRYASHRMFAIYGNNTGGESKNVPGPVDQEYTKYIKTTTCNEYGEFEFSNLGTGTYYFVAGVTWRQYGQQYKTGFMRRSYLSNNGVSFVVLQP